MPSFLTFALVAPMASFGGLAVGERRSGWDRPARSAVLGLIGACLGVEREDDAGQAALADGYYVALYCHAPGRLLADYHTAQMPSAKRGRRFATRAEELAVPKWELNTVLSRRDYRVGAWHLGAVWPSAAAPQWSLEELAAAMTRPVFVPSLGRKSCPLGLPLAPRIGEAADARAALMARHADGPEATLTVRGGLTLRDAQADTPQPAVIAMDASVADGQVRRIEYRRDQPLSRSRWQFGLREEAVLGAASQ